MASIVVSVLGTVADALLLYAPGFSLDRYNAVLAIPPTRLLAGYYLGLVVLPLYALGYWVMYEAVKSAGRWRSRLLLSTGIIGTILGTTFHAVAGLAVKSLLERAKTTNLPVSDLGPYTPFVVPIFILVHAIVIAGTVWYALTIWSGRTIFPRWMILLSPGVLTAILFLISAAGPPIGDFLQPTALNLAHIGFFGGTTILLWKHAQDDDTPPPDRKASAA